MVEQARIVRVIIASPSDLEDERKCIPELFLRWNAAHDKVVLVPEMWESSSVPEMGSHPQEILNKQMIERGDLLVALFWSKIGTPTLTDKSGTIEEIREFIQEKGALRVMVYFCNRHLPKSPNDLNIEEIAGLQEFKEEMKSKGLYKDFTHINELEGLLYQHLDMKVKQLLDDKLPIPGSQTVKLSEESWYRTDAPDPRMRTPIDFGNSLTEIANGFSRRMDEFDQEDGATNNKFLSLGAHVYRSVAHAIEHVLILKPYDIPISVGSAFKKIILRLNSLAESKSIEGFSEFWEKGRKISDELKGLVERVDRDKS